MRVEKHYGKNIVCGHIFKDEEIKIGQEWQGSSGSTVKVTEIKDDWVTYMQSNGVACTKSAFAFQCRYCLVVEDGFEISTEFSESTPELISECSTKLVWYRWDADIGEILACAENLEDARKQVMSTLSANDGARDELASAISIQPEIIGNKPQSFVCWHQ